MSIPILVLLGFAGWTVAVLMGSIGLYRWSRILSGQASIAEFRADLPQGSDWYQRAMRAHMNCIENLPIYTAIVMALVATGIESTAIDYLSIAILPARIAQTLIHIIPTPTNATISFRFGFFCIQLACIIALGVITIAGAMARTA